MPAIAKDLDSLGLLFGLALESGASREHVRRRPKPETDLEPEHRHFDMTIPSTVFTDVTNAWPRPGNFQLDATCYEFHIIGHWTLFLVVVNIFEHFLRCILLRSYFLSFIKEGHNCI